VGQQTGDCSSCSGIMRYLKTYSLSKILRYTRLHPGAPQLCSMVSPLNPHLRDDIVSHGAYGIFGSGAGEGARALDSYAPGAIVTGNILVGAPPSLYGPYAAANSFPVTYEPRGSALPGIAVQPGTPALPSPDTPAAPAPNSTTPTNDGPKAVPDSGAAGENEIKRFAVLIMIAMLMPMMSWFRCLPAYSQFHDPLSSSGVSRAFL
jgi:hypothetical protein